MAAACPLSAWRHLFVATARKTICGPLSALLYRNARPAIDRIDFAFHNIGVRTSNPHGAAPAGRFSERKILFCGPFALERRLSSRIAWQPRAWLGNQATVVANILFPRRARSPIFVFLEVAGSSPPAGMVRPDRRIDRAASVNPILQPHAASWFSRSVMNIRRKRVNRLTFWLTRIVGRG